MSSEELLLDDTYQQYHSIEAFAARFPTPKERKRFVDSLLAEQAALDQMNRDLDERVRPLFGKLEDTVQGRDR